MRGGLLGEGEWGHGKDICQSAVFDPCTDPCGERIGVPWSSHLSSEGFHSSNTGPHGLSQTPRQGNAPSEK